MLVKFGLFTFGENPLQNQIFWFFCTLIDSFTVKQMFLALYCVKVSRVECMAELLVWIVKSNNLVQLLAKRSSRCLWYGTVCYWTSLIMGVSSQIMKFVEYKTEEDVSMVVQGCVSTSTSSTSLRWYQVYLKPFMQLYGLDVKTIHCSGENDIDFRWWIRLR